jgi:hypothetical protein
MFDINLHPVPGTWWSLCGCYGQWSYQTRYCWRFRVSWLPANVMTECSCNVTENQDTDVFVMVCFKFVSLEIICLSAPTISSWWSQLGVMAAHCCYSWWRWWSNILWAIHIRLWLCSLSCYLPFTIKVLLQSFVHNLIDMLLKVPEHVYDGHCCSNCLSVCFQFCFFFSLGLGFFFLDAFLVGCFHVVKSKCP